MNAARFNGHAARGRHAAQQHLAQLERGYQQALQTAGTEAARTFTRLATDHLTADASNPGWTPPEDSQLIDEQALAADAKKRTRAAHTAALKAVTAPVLDDVGVAFDLTNPLAAGLLDTLGVRARDLSDAIRSEVARAVLTGYQQGWSVADTAKAIKQAAWDIAPARASMLARTDLNGIANGGSIMAARLVNNTSDVGEPQVGYKQWIATEDERTRESHAQADGQIVPIDQPFQVGGEEADYPASPDLSDEESCNCRCAVGFLEAADAAGPPAGQELPLAASVGRPDGGVASPGRMDESPDDTLTAGVTITVGDDTAAETAEAAVPTRWRAILCIEGQQTQDSAALTRMLAEGETTWRDLPLPLGVMYETPHSDEVTAELCGQIDTIYRDDTDYRVIWGEGSFNQDDQGARAAARVADLSLRGISIDPYVPRVEFFDEPAASDNEPALTRVVMHDAVICAATICPVQALDGAQISVVASGLVEDGADELMPFQSDTCFVLTRDHVVESVAASGAATDRDIGELLARMEERLERRQDEQADRVKSLTALVAAAVDEITAPKALLERLGRDIEAVRGELARKPRVTELVRDNDGRLVGTREQ